MSYFNRRHLLIAGASLLVSACNFTPIYGPEGAGSQIENRILIKAPTTKDAYFVTRRLETRLGRAATGSTTRVQRVGSLSYTLKNSATGKNIAKGSVSNFTGYSATGNTAATLAAERAAIERLMNILADQLVDRLLLLDPATLP
jgi:LPS-assembly lipoprotein